MINQLSFLVASFVFIVMFWQLGWTNRELSLTLPLLPPDGFDLPHPTVSFCLPGSVDWHGSGRRGGGKVSDAGSWHGILSLKLCCVAVSQPGASRLSALCCVTSNIRETTFTLLLPPREQDPHLLYSCHRRPHTHTRYKGKISLLRNNYEGVTCVIFNIWT